MDASDCLDLLLPQSISVFAFDFSGSGLSDGETISLGFYEQDDLMAVIDYLRGSGLVSRIGLWGRSMGAATSVLVAARDPSIAGMVLDSAFSSLTQVMYELANQYMKQVKVPKILINGAISVLRKSVQKKGNFDIRDVNPEEAADKCFIPVGRPLWLMVLGSWLMVLGSGTRRAGDGRCWDRSWRSGAAC